MVHERSNNPGSLDIKLLWIFNDIPFSIVRVQPINASTTSRGLVVGRFSFSCAKDTTIFHLGSPEFSSDFPRALWRVVEAAAWWEHPLSSC